MIENLLKAELPWNTRLIVSIYYLNTYILHIELQWMYRFGESYLNEMQLDIILKTHEILG